MRKLDPRSRSADSAEDNFTIIARTAPHTPPAVEIEKIDLHSPAGTIENLNKTPSPRHDSPSSTPVDPNASSVSSIPLQVSDNGGRPQRNRHPPNKFEL
jgi:hypothetical protein